MSNLANKFGSNEEKGAEDESGSDGSTTSTAHLYIVENGDPDARGAGQNHSQSAWSLVKQGGTLYKAFTERDGQRYAWTVSDSLSHMLDHMEPTVSAFDFSTKNYVALFCQALEGLAQVAEDDNHQTYLELYEPSGSDLAEYVRNSDNFEDAEELREALAELEEADE